MADAQFEAFFANGGGAVGIFPIFPPKRPLNSYIQGSPEGFVGDGDAFTLPATINGGGSLSYNNNAGSVVWTKAVTDINPACNAWVTFNLDAVDGLLWVLAIDTVGNRFYLAAINAAGAVVVKGNPLATVTLSAATHGWVGGLLSAARGGNLWRDVQGAGDFTARLSNVDVVFSSTTGSIVSESPAKTGYLPGMFPASGGALFTPGSIDAAQGTQAITGALQSLHVRKSKVSAPARYAIGTLLAPPSQLGLPYDLNQTTGGGSVYATLQWKGDVLLQRPGAQLQDTCVLFDRQEYLDAVDALMLNLRLE